MHGDIEWKQNAEELCSPMISRGISPFTSHGAKDAQPNGNDSFASFDKKCMNGSTLKR